MKKKLIAIFLGCSLSFSIFSLHTNKTTFVPHSPSQDLILQEPLIRYKRNHLPKNQNFDLDHTLFFQGSTNRTDICRYFFINGQNNLVVKDADVDGYRDISADWLNIDSTSTGNLFQSTLTMSPHSRRFGIILNAHYKVPVASRLWFQGILPFIQAETKLSLKERNIQNQSPPRNGAAIDESTNAREAFHNPFWKYGKLNPGITRKAGLGDITLKIGWNSVDKKDTHNALYTSCIIPTAPHPRQEYIFEPFLGNGGHIGLGIGNHFDYNFHTTKKHSVNFLSTIDYVYLLKATQFRTFDLLSNGPWSRYLQTVTRAYPDNVNYGANSFTQRMKVEPGSTLSMLSSLHYEYTISPRHTFKLECGHNFWFREKEEISLKNPWNESMGIASLIAGDTSDTANSKTQPTATIATNKANNDTPFTFTPILENNINLNSAAHSTVLSNTAFLAFGIDGTFKGHGYSWKGGLAFEKGSSNAALDQWSTWISLKITL